MKPARFFGHLLTSLISPVAKAADRDSETKAYESFIVTSGKSSIPGITFRRGDRVRWKKSLDAQSYALSYRGEDHKEHWAAKLHWSYERKDFSGNPSFKDTDILDVTFSGAVGKRRMHAKISSPKPFEDGEVGSWTADEDPPEL